MIHPNMSVTDFVMTLWKNKVKVVLVAVALAFGPGLYADWQRKRAVEQEESDRRAVDTEASLAGMMLADAWRACSKIGIVNDMDRCAAYQPRLIQEQAAPLLAKTAVDQRDSYVKRCQRFYQGTYCSKLLQRAVEISVAQGKD